MEKGPHVFGVALDFSVQFGPVNAGCAFPINSRELMATTLKELIRFEGDLIKQRWKGPYACACLIGDSGLIAAHTHRGSKLIICDLYDIKRPLYECEDPTSGVFHLAYFPGSRSIVAIGSGISVYSISWARLRTSCPSVNLSLRSQFAPGYDTTLLSPPCFDEKNELIFLPTKDGVRPFDFDGKEKALATRFPTQGSTVFAFCRENGKLLTSDPENGLCLWTKNGQLAQRYGIAGGSILAMAFVDSENVVFVNAYAAIYAMNVKTGRPFHCYNIEEHPARFSMFWHRGVPKIGLCIGGSFVQLNVTLPWKVWAMNVYRAKAIQRCNKMEKAARVFVETENSYAKIYSPKTAKLLTSATSRESSRLVEMLYDRGVFMEYKWIEEECKYVEEPICLAQGHDRLLMVMDDGACLSYDPGTVPSELRDKREIRAIGIQLACYRDMYMFCVATNDGYLVLYDYETWEERERFNLGKIGPTGIKYIHDIRSCVVLFDGKMGLYDMEGSRFSDWTTTSATTASSVHGNLLVLGFEDGEITRYNLRNRAFELLKADSIPKPHTERVTGFAFCADRWLSCSLDCMVLIWDYKQSLVSKIVLPFPIYSIHLLNGKRDLLVAMENEIMSIDGSIIFRDVDQEDKRIDNYDTLDDPLNAEPVPELRMNRHLTIESSEQQRKSPRTKKSPRNTRAASFRQQLNEFNNTRRPVVSTPGTAGATTDDEQERQRKIEAMKKMVEDEELARERMTRASQEMLDNQRANEEAKKDEEEEQAKETEEGNDGENEDCDDDDTKKKGKKKRPPASPRSAVDFLKDSMAEEGKKKRKRKPKRSNEPDEDKGKKDPPAPVDPENSKNLLQKLQNKMREMSHTGKERPKEGPKRKIETDITKMSFIECTTSVTEPDVPDDEQNPKKRSPRLKRKRSSNVGNGNDEYDESDYDDNDNDDKDTEQRKRSPRKKFANARSRRPRKSGAETADQYDSDEDYPSEDSDEKTTGKGRKEGDPNRTTRTNRRPSIQTGSHHVGRSGKDTSDDIIPKSHSNAQTTKQHSKNSSGSVPSGSLSNQVSNSPNTYRVKSGRPQKLNTPREIWLNREANRSQTPAPVRLNYPRTKRRKGRANTPPMRAKKFFGIPTPNIVLDHQAVLRLYGKGHTELLPAINRMLREGRITKGDIPVPGSFADSETSQPFLTHSYKFPMKASVVPRAPRCSFSIDESPRIHKEATDQMKSAPAPVDPFCPRPPNVQGMATPGKRVEIRLNLPLPEDNPQIYVSSPRQSNVSPPPSLHTKRLAQLSPRDFASTEKLSPRGLESLESFEKVQFNKTSPPPERRVSFDTSDDFSSNYSPRRCSFPDYDSYMEKSPEINPVDVPELKPLSAPADENRGARPRLLPLAAQFRIVPPEPKSARGPGRQRLDRSLDALRKIIPLPPRLNQPVGRAITGRVSDRLRQTRASQALSPKSKTLKPKPLFFSDDEDEENELTGFSSLYASITGGSVVTVHPKTSSPKRKR